MTKKPSYRFVGYTEPWVEKKLGEVVDVNSGKDYKHLSKGEIPVYGTGGYMLSVSESLSDADGIGIGRKGTIDKPYILKAPFWTVDTLFYCIPRDAYNLYFVYSIFNNVTWKKFDESTGVPSLSKITINNIQSSFPSLPEQTAIGSFFQDIDQLISLQQRKLEVLKEQKKTYLKLLFPAKGQTKPALRFAGFEDDWKEVKVSDIFRVTRGQVLATTEISEEKTDTHKYPVYSSQTKNEGLLGYYDKYLFETAITWTTDGANAGTVNYREGKFYSTNVNGVLLSDEGFANKVIAEILNNEAWKYVSKVGNPKLMNNVMSEISLVIPNDFREISTLSTFFQDLDKVIAKQEEKVNQLKESKQTLLRKMFI